MRKIFLLFGLMVLGFNCLAQTKAPQTKTVKTFYDPLSKTKIHEQWTALTAPPYKKHGLYREWDAVGNIICEKNYKNGVLNGQFKLYVFIPDEMDMKCYGKLLEESFYINGKKHGTFKSYLCKNGQLQPMEVTQYVNGEATKIETWHFNGSKQKSVQPNGPNTLWFDNGKVAESYTNNNGKADGEYLRYFETGAVKSRFFLKNGNRIGRSTYYDENGNEIAGGTSDNDGSPTGKWTYLVNKKDELTDDKEEAVYLYKTEYDAEGYQTENLTTKYSLSGEKLKEGSFTIQEDGSITEDKM